MAKKKTLQQLREENDLKVERMRAQRLRAALKAMRSAAGQPRGVVRTDRYDNATRTRLRPGPRASAGSADKHLSGSVRAALRRDCQDLERNSTVARIIIRRAQQFIVGDGPTVTATTSDKAWNAEADRLWREYFDGHDPERAGYVDVRRQRTGPELLAGTVSAWCTDGDELYVLTSEGSVQVIESERVVSPGGFSAIPRTLPGGGTIVDGVESDKVGRTVRYHVGRWNERGQLATENPVPVPWRFARLVTNPIGIRTGFTRGEPALQAVTGRIERLDSYDESTAVAAEIATLFAALVESEDPGQQQADMEAATSDQPTQTNPNAPNTVDLQRGTVQYLSRGGRVSQVKPEFPTTAFREYVLWHMMLIGAELGIPVVGALYDASGLSWSNIKALLALSMRSIEPCQARLAGLVRWIRDWRLRSWMDAGLLDPHPDYTACSIVFPRPPVLDFKSEVEGILLAINGRLMTHEQGTQQLGTGVATDVFGNLKSEIDVLRAYGIEAVQAPGSQSNGPGNPNPDPGANPGPDPGNQDPSNRAPGGA